jgi:hypothetical protein
MKKSSIELFLTSVAATDNKEKENGSNEIRYQLKMAWSH